MRRPTMAVNDAKSEILGRGEKRLADPQQIEGALIVEPDPRSDAGMDKQIIAEPIRKP